MHVATNACLHTPRAMQASALESAVQRFVKLEDAAHETQLLTELREVRGLSCTSRRAAVHLRRHVRARGGSPPTNRPAAQRAALAAGARVWCAPQDVAVLLGKSASEAHRELAALQQQHVGLKTEAGKLGR